MAAGVPVVSLEAPGVCDVVQDSINGRMLCAEDIAEFAGALQSFALLSADEIGRFKSAATRTAAKFSQEIWAAKAIKHYEK